MKAIGDIPSEVLDEIFSNLDGESMIVASKVCLLWRRVVHEFTSLRASKCDTELKEKLEKCGWFFGEHDFEYCKCIELNIGLFKFIGSESLSCQELGREQNRNCLYLLPQNKLFNNDYSYGDGILMYDIRQGKFEQSYLLDENLRYVNAARIQDQTLVIEEYDNDPNDGRLMVWNLKTVQNVSELNFRGKAFEFTGDRNCRIDLVDIAIVRHKLAVHLLTRDKVTNRLQHRITQIWKLDTDNPSTENIHYWTTIEHDLDFGFMYQVEGKLLMNSKLLSLQVSKFAKNECYLNVLLIDDPSTSTTTSFERGLPHDFQTDIEEGFSNRIAVFHWKDNSLKVYKFFDGNDVCCLVVNLNPVVSMNRGRLRMANFLMGKIMFILQSVSQFQCIIVTEEGEVIDGNRQEVQLDDVRDVAFNAYGIFVKKGRVGNPILFFK